MSVAVCTTTQTAAAPTAARARGSVTRRNTCQGPAAVSASSSSSRSTQQKPWPAIRTTQGKAATAWIQTAAIPWPHGVQSSSPENGDQEIGRGLFHRDSVSQPPLPSAACQPEAITGRGTNRVRSKMPRSTPRQGRSVR